MTRFDIPTQIRDLLAAAVRLNVIDAAEVFTLGCTVAADWPRLRSEVMEAAFANRHGPLGREKHRELCILNDRAAAAGC